MNSYSTSWWSLLLINRMLTNGITRESSDLSELPPLENPRKKIIKPSRFDLRHTRSRTRLPYTSVSLSAWCRHRSSFISWYTVTTTMSSDGEPALRWLRLRRRRRVNNFSVADVTTVSIPSDVGSGMSTRNNSVCSPDSSQLLSGAAVLRQITMMYYSQIK